MWHKYTMAKKFQSTPSARRATTLPVRAMRRTRYFNPRPPRGERPLIVVLLSFGDVISIHALREESDHLQPPADDPQQQISIHALREESDCWSPACCRSGWYFNPRPPRGERRSGRRADRGHQRISIHALREEGDIHPFLRPFSYFYFNPRPPRGGRQQKRRKNPPRLFHYTHLCTI